MKPSALHALGGALFLCSLASVRLEPLAENVSLWLLLYGTASILLGAAVLGGTLGGLPSRQRERRLAGLGFGAGWILLWAALIRLPLMATSPTLSDDINRYVWEGRVVTEGFDPYDYAPDDPIFSALAEEAPEWQGVNHPHLPAIYPPGAQWTFAGLALVRPDAFWFRAFFLLCDLGVCALLLGLLRVRGKPVLLAILYAWHPLASVEVASSGHFEPLAILPLLGGMLLWEFGRFKSSFVLWGAAFTLKVVGGVAGLFGFAMLIRKRQLLVALSGAVLWLLLPLGLAIPFALDGKPPVGSALVYGEHWTNYGSVHALLGAVVGAQPARWMAMALGVVWTLWLLRRAEPPLLSFLLFFCGLLLLSPVVHPWYALWILVLLPLYPRWDLYALVSLLPLSYLAWSSATVGGEWLAPSWAVWVSYGIPAGLFALSRKRG